MTTAKPRPKHRSYTFLGLTQSLCPECHEVVPAKIIARGKRVYFRKNCPKHGEREDFICSDVARYDRLDDSQPAKLPQKTYAPVRDGCPRDCGLCIEHEQHTCIGVIEITDGCNLTCPMCYAASSPGQAHKTVDQVKAAIDRIVEAEGHAEVIQLSGGEPTLHPNLLEFIQYAIEQPIDYVMINTNGIRFAHDQGLVEQIAQYKDRVEIYFQFDSLDDVQVAKLRGQEGLVETKLKALEKLSAAGLNVTLVSTLQGGVNDDAPADLMDFAAQHKCITGLSFQPATYSGRFTLPEELERRITFPDVVDTIAADARNSFTAEDFFPLPCAHPNCHWLGIGIRGDDGFKPLTQYIDTKTHIDLLANGISFTREQTQQIASQVLSRIACGDDGCCTPSEPTQSGDAQLHSISGLEGIGKEEDVQQFLQQVVEQTVGARDIIRITITSFLDVYNFDLRRVMKCCTHHILPSGHIIPFCAYNVLYRDGKVPLPELS
ncbi:MAG: radical SAM protein [Aureliella sp.]